MRTVPEPLGASGEYREPDGPAHMARRTSPPEWSVRLTGGTEPATLGAHMRDDGSSVRDQGHRAGASASGSFGYFYFAWPSTPSVGGAIG